MCGKAFYICAIPKLNAYVNWLCQQCALQDNYKVISVKWLDFGLIFGLIFGLFNFGLIVLFTLNLGCVSCSNTDITLV